MTDDDKPFTSDLKTLFKMRLPRHRVRFLRNFGWLIVFNLGFALGLGILGTAQYLICTSKNPDITFLQCIRHEGLKEKLHGKNR